MTESVVSFGQKSARDVELGILLQRILQVLCGFEILPRSGRFEGIAVKRQRLDRLRRKLGGLALAIEQAATDAQTIPDLPGQFIHHSEDGLVTLPVDDDRTDSGEPCG